MNTDLEARIRLLEQVLKGDYKYMKNLNKILDGNTLSGKSYSDY